MYENSYIKSIPTYTFLLPFLLGIAILLYFKFEMHWLTYLGQFAFIFSLLQIRHCYTLRYMADGLVIRNKFFPFLGRKFKYDQVEKVVLSPEPVFFSKTLRIVIRTKTRHHRYSLGYIPTTKLNEIIKDLEVDGVYAVKDESLNL